jgi:hypothetical protein
VEVELHDFLTSALDGGDWSASRPGRFTPRGVWVDPRAGLDAVARRKNPIIALQGIEPRSSSLQPSFYVYHTHLK